MFCRGRLCLPGWTRRPLAGARRMTLFKKTTEPTASAASHRDAVPSACSLPWRSEGPAEMPGRFPSIELRSFLLTALRGWFDEDEPHQLLLAKLCKANASWPTTVLPMLLQSGMPVDRTGSWPSTALELRNQRPRRHSGGVRCRLRPPTSTTQAVTAKRRSGSQRTTAATGVVMALLTAGANFDQADNRLGVMPLAIATRYGHTGTVVALLAAGDSVSRADNFDQTPIDMAASDETSYSSFRGGRRVFSHWH